MVRGEGRITAKQLAMLSALGLLSDGQVDMSMYLGAALLMAGIAVLLLLTLRDPDYQILNSTPRLILLLIIMVLTLGLSMLARLVNAYLAPMLLCAIPVLGYLAGFIWCLATVIIGCRSAFRLNWAQTAAGCLPIALLLLLLLHQTLDVMSKF